MAAIEMRRVRPVDDTKEEKVKKNRKNERWTPSRPRPWLLHPHKVKKQGASEQPQAQGPVMGEQEGN